MNSILIYTFNEIDIDDFVDYELLKRSNFQEDIKERLEIVKLKKNRDIRNDIIDRSSSTHFTRYFIINKSGFTRAQSRADTFTRHFLILNKFDFTETLTEILCQSIYFKDRIDKHMLVHNDFTKECSKIKR
jgi:hypothetical protein